MNLTNQTNSSSYVNTSNRTYSSILLTTLSSTRNVTSKLTRSSLNFTFSRTKANKNERNGIVCNFTNQFGPMNRKYYSEENFNIWKLAFLTLAFIVGFISLVLILTFTVKIFANKYQRRSQFKKQNLKNSPLHSSKANLKISSISLLDFDGETSSRSSSPNQRLNKKRTLSSTPSTPKLKSPGHKPETTSTTTSSCLSNAYSSHFLFSEITNQLDILTNFQSQNPFYGFTNKAFSNDFDKLSQQKVPSSFRPLLISNPETETQNSQKEIKIESPKLKAENKKSETTETYATPWKIPNLSNEYAPLEVHTVTNPSPVTIYSEVYSESKTNIDCASVTNDASTLNINTNKIKDFSLLCSNNNEFISNSSKITQELEKKLKERRQQMESKSEFFSANKTLDQNSNEMNTSDDQSLSLSNLEKKIQSWQSELKNKSAQLKVASSSSSCICPCHSHSHSHSSHNHSHSKSSSNLERKSNLDRKESREKDKLHKLSFQNRQISKAKELKSSDSTCRNKKPKIIIDTASTLPTKRESIRALIENKSVSQNKQKDVLEMHLNTLLSSRRINASKIVE